MGSGEEVDIEASQRRRLVRRTAIVVGLGCLGGTCEPDVTNPPPRPADLEAPTAVIAPGVVFPGTSHLVCELELQGAAASSEVEVEIRWAVDGGAPDPGTTTFLTTTYPGDTLSADRPRGGETWSCEARVVSDADASDWTVAEREIQQANVIVILVDDLGWSELGHMSNGAYHTPNLDALAAEGVRFTSGYVTGPVCSPSRAGLLTGRYPQRFGFEFNVHKEVRERGDGMPADQPTLASVAQGAGHTTGLVGKWHLGGTAEPLGHALAPWSRGFDSTFGFLGGRRYSMDPTIFGTLTAFDEGLFWPPDRDDEVLLIDGGPPLPPNVTHLTDVFADEAIDWLHANSDDPFFLYLSFNAPHIPLQAPLAHLSLVTQGTLSQEQYTHLASVAALDDRIGDVLATLDETGIADQTLVWFISDNGCPWEDECWNAELIGGKGLLTEGGVRVPFLARWPGVIEPGTVIDDPVTAMDVMPTLARLVGVPSPPTDGVDLLPHILGRAESPPHEQIYWKMGASRAIREGNWKLHESGGTSWLFDVDADPAESADVLSQHPDVVERLRSALDDWEQELPPASWPAKWEYVVDHQGRTYAMDI